MFQQHRQCRLHRLPNNFEIDVEVAGCDPITHPTHAAPGHVWVACREIRVAIHELRRRFTNDDEAHDDCILGAPIGEKVVLAHTFDEIARVGRGSLDVIEPRPEGAFTSPITG